jgi:magnesium chelatase family protein
MPVFSTHTVRLHGDHGTPTIIEAHVANGLPTFTVVGLPDGPCRETRDRVRAAFLSSGFAWPLKRITVAATPQSGSRPFLSGSMDLAIAVAILVASEQLQAELINDISFIGELGLDGSLRRVPGIVALVHDSTTAQVVIPAGEPVTAINGQVTVLGKSLSQIVESLKTGCWLESPPLTPPSNTGSGLPVEQIRGNESAISALMVAATGRHHLLLQGASGTGKSVLPKCLPGLLPSLSDTQLHDVQRIQSAAGLSYLESGIEAPMRSPHHSSSMVSVLGGGTSAMRPGEMSCAHHGVLFFDDLEEFAPPVLDAVRHTINSGNVIVSRATGTTTLPAKFLFVAALSSCACGSEQGKCRCSDAAKQRYRRRVDTTLMHRFDLRVTTVTPPLHAPTCKWTTAELSARVGTATALAWARQGCLNGDLTDEQLEQVMQLTDTTTELLARAVAVGSLSQRSIGRVRRVARTIADLRNEPGNAVSVDVVEIAIGMFNGTSTPAMNKVEEL